MDALVSEFNGLHIAIRVLSLLIVVQFFYTAGAVLKVLKRTLLPHKRRA